MQACWARDPAQGIFAPAGRERPGPVVGLAGGRGVSMPGHARTHLAPQDGPSQPVTNQRTPSGLTIRKAGRRGRQRVLVAAVFAQRLQAVGLYQAAPGAAARVAGLTPDGRWNRPADCLRGLVRGNRTPRALHVGARERGLLLLEGLGLPSGTIVMQLRQPGSWVGVGVLGGCPRFHPHSLPGAPARYRHAAGHGLAPSAPPVRTLPVPPADPAAPRGHAGTWPNRYKRPQQRITVWKAPCALSCDPSLPSLGPSPARA